MSYSTVIFKFMKFVKVTHVAAQMQWLRLGGMDASKKTVVVFAPLYVHVPEVDSDYQTFN